MKRIIAVVKTLWERLPYIAIYTISSLIILMAGREFYRWAAPGSWYLSYESYQVESVPEGENIPYNVCRGRYGNFEVTGGARTIFQIEDVNKPNNETILIAVEFIPGTSTSAEKCVSSYIDIIGGKDVLELKEGDYRVTHTIRFKVGKYEKESTIRSNIFHISKKVLTPEDMRNRIEELQREIDSLKAQLARIGLSGSNNSSNTTQTVATPQSSQNVSSTQNPGNSGGNNGGGNGGGNEEPEQPSLVERIINRVDDTVQNIDKIGDRIL